MSAQLHELRAAAARRRQQSEGLRAPLQSPVVSDCDAESMHSLRSAASSRRSHLSRSSTLTQVASAKSEPFTSVDSQAESYAEVDEENLDPKEFHDVEPDEKSVKSVVREEKEQAKTTHKEKSFRRSTFRCSRLYYGETLSPQEPGKSREIPAKSVDPPIS